MILPSPKDCPLRDWSIRIDLSWGKLLVEEKKVSDDDDDDIYLDKLQTKGVKKSILSQCKT
jgi:hypothetical protein